MVIDRMEKNHTLVLSHELTGLWRSSDITPIIDQLKNDPSLLHLSIPSDYNELDDVMLDQLCKLTNITALSLGDLMLKTKWDIILTTLQKLPLLTKLEFLSTEFIDTVYRNHTSVTTDLAILSTMSKIKEFNANYFPISVMEQQKLLIHLTSLTSLSIKERPSQILFGEHLDLIINKDSMLHLDPSGFRDGLSKAYLFKNLTSLHYQTSSADINYLTMLTALRSLKMTTDKIHNIANISVLTNLRILSLLKESCGISILTTLTKLEELWVGSTVSDLTNNNNNISNAWNNFPHLTALNVTGKISSDLLSKFPKRLQTLKFFCSLNEQTKIDLDGLMELKELAFMNGTPYFNTSKLSSTLTSLHVVDSNVGILPTLTKFGNLRHLYGRFKEPAIPNKKLNCGELSSLTNLVSLHTNVALDVSLQTLVNLTSLSFFGHKADPLAHIIGHFHNLKELRLNCEQIGDIGGELKNLHDLKLFEITKATDVTSKVFKHFKSLTNLKVIRVLPAPKSKLKKGTKFLHRFLVLKNLHVLEISGLGQSGLHAETLHFCTQLRQITMNGQILKLNPENLVHWSKAKVYKPLKLGDLLSKK
jgi:hypothetical protein